MNAGMMAIGNFPLAVQMARALAQSCQVTVLRFDTHGGDELLFNQCVSAASDHSDVIKVMGTEKWNRWNWREDMIRALDPIKPKFVLAPDSDERFGPGLEEDLAQAVISRSDVLMFDYVMASSDGRPVKKYPGAPHCKAFLWVPGITYRPYRGYARPTWPGRPAREFRASTKILHYCFYTPALEREKMKNLHN